MTESIINGLMFIQSEQLNHSNKVSHFFTTRNGGVSKGIFESLNFGTHYGEDKHFTDNLRFVAKAHNIHHSAIIIPKQTHGCNIAIVTNRNKEEVFHDTDALVTNVAGICVAVKTADCVPILVFDPIKKVVAAIHAGWRGTASKIVVRTIEQMRLEFGCNPEDILAVIGPSIGQHNYEVGSEVVGIFKVILPLANQLFDISTFENGKARLNVAEANRLQLMESGLQPENIDHISLCTFDNQHLFYSARRDGAKTGRMLNGIMLQ
jgi:polyphenol oxidase